MESGRVTKFMEHYLREPIRAVNFQPRVRDHACITRAKSESHDAIVWVFPFGMADIFAGYGNPNLACWNLRFHPGQYRIRAPTGFIS